jgi:type I restriction enzyme S subunit
MSDWKEYTLSDIAEIHNSKRIPLNSLQRQHKKGSYPYYGASGIVDYIDEYIFDGEYVLISEDGENLNSRQTPIAFEAKGQFWVNNHAHIVKGKKQFVNKLIVSYLQQLDLTPFITGAVQPKLSKENLLSIPFYLPIDDTEKAAIASILSSLDDKIDLLHRQNKTLESLAETLFRQWFVEEAEEGWEEISLYNAIELVGGGTPKTNNPAYWNGNIPWLSGGDIASNHKDVILSAEQSITALGLENSSARLLPRMATVISARGTVGKYCILSKPMAFSQSNYGVLPKFKDCFCFTYLLVAHSVSALQSAAYGSVFDTITTSTFKEHSLHLPKEKIIQRFESEVKPFFDKMMLNKLQIQTLTQLRNTLLPKLMSGEVRVKMM